jgi:UDP-N-acetylmuramoyl-tripeptide--D-alanyl-D-alanine ligase
MSALTAAPIATLAQVAEWSGGELEPGAALAARAAIEGVSIDTRTLKGGELFVPLAGRHADGHEFLAEAFRRGAAAALCLRARHAALKGREPGPLVVVEDVTEALQRLARRHRQGFSGALIGITGSSGKTTTKDLVARVLAADRPTLATEGNLNNHWGVPLTLLRLRSEHRAAVVEIGTNHPGEIGALAGIALPTGALITNVGSAHLEHFGSIEAIAREKAALGFALPPEGVLFAGADSPALMHALTGVRCRVVTFGLSPGAEVRPSRVEDLGPQGSRVEVDGFPPLELPLVGRHQVPNALGALAVARELNLDPAATVAALESYRAPKGRMEVRRARGAALLVDCYNANPESMRAALETLSDWPGATRRIAVLGDMLELGESAGRLHRATAAAVRDAELWVVGQYAQAYVEGALEARVTTRLFSDQPSLKAELIQALAPGVVVLFKASRGAALEQVVEGLEAGG